MILRKYMSLLGIGSPKIDLVLEKVIYAPGEKVDGYFSIKGGTIEQKLKRIDCDLVMVDELRGKEKVVDFITILTAECIQSGETSNIPFSFRLPDSATVSTGTLIYRFKTKLSFKEGVESFDTDEIKIAVG